MQQLTGFGPVGRPSAGSVSGPQQQDDVSASPGQHRQAGVVWQAELPAAQKSEHQE
jgi:hypothetical protein